MPSGAHTTPVEAERLLQQGVDLIEPLPPEVRQVRSISVKGSRMPGIAPSLALEVPWGTQRKGVQTLFGALLGQGCRAVQAPESVPGPKGDFRYSGVVDWQGRRVIVRLYPNAKEERRPYAVTPKDLKRFYKTAETIGGVSLRPGQQGVFYAAVEVDNTGECGHMTLFDDRWDGREPNGPVRLSVYHVKGAGILKVAHLTGE